MRYSPVNNKQLLDEVEQNIVIYLWRADVPKLDRGKYLICEQMVNHVQYFAIAAFNNCFNDEKNHVAIT